MPCQIGKAHGFTDLPAFIEQTLAQLAVPEPAAEAFNLFTLPVLITLSNPPHAFGGNVLSDFGFHLDKNKAAVAAILLVQLQHSMACSC